MYFQRLQELKLNLASMKSHTFGWPLTNLTSINKAYRPNSPAILCNAL